MDIKNMTLRQVADHLRTNYGIEWFDVDQRFHDLGNVRVVVTKYEQCFDHCASYLAVGIYRGEPAQLIERISVPLE